MNMYMFQRLVLIYDVFCLANAMAMAAKTPTTRPTITIRVPMLPFLSRAYAYTTPTIIIVIMRSSTTFTN